MGINKIASSFNVKKILALLLGLIVIGVAVNEWPRIWPILKRVDPWWLAAGIGFYLANYLFRAVRLNALINSRMGVWPGGFNVVSIHGVLTYLMPMRTGDLSLPAILKATYGCGWDEGIHALVWARMLDFFSLGLWLLFSVVFLPMGLDTALLATLAITALIFISLPFLLWKFVGSDLFRKFKFLEKFSSVNKGGLPPASALLSSVAVWAMVGMGFYAAARAAGLNLELGEAWFVVTVQLPLQLMPIQGIANSGNHEAGWMAALSLLGYSAGSALDFALVTHALLTVYVLALGATGWLASRIFGRSKKG